MGAESPLLTVPTEGEAASRRQPPGRTAPAVSSAVARPAPPPGALPPATACRELTAGHTCTAAVGACQHHAWLQGRRPVPADNQRRQTWPAPMAPGHPCGVQSCLSWPALHLTRPPWGRRSRQQAVQGGYSGRQAGTLGTWPVSTFPSPSMQGPCWSVTSGADQRPWLRGHRGGVDRVCLRRMEPLTHPSGVYRP